LYNEVFEEMEVDDSILSKKWVLNHRTKIICYLLTVTVLAIVARTLMEISEKIVINSQINALNEGTKQCAIYFYYSTDSALAVCASCD